MRDLQRASDDLGLALTPDDIKELAEIALAVKNNDLDDPKKFSEILY